LQLPGEGVFLLILNAVILLGWILALARGWPLRRHVALLAATTGVWFLGLGLALWHVHRAGLNMSRSGIGDPRTFIGDVADSLIITAVASQATLALTALAIIGFAIRTPSRPLEGDHES
jgi:hypothetical protein